MLENQKVRSIQSAVLVFWHLESVTVLTVDSYLIRQLQEYLAQTLKKAIYVNICQHTIYFLKYEVPNFRWSIDIELHEWITCKKGKTQQAV